ncbi:hypothetical protein PUN28_011494 [Cardiocondyla obscurior]|uniref:Uncharacterized protein n=1 Tax=Cardiocondyla obscurior TaxID=286306 RepID=A0AAW2FGK9_9HYME
MINYNRRILRTYGSFHKLKSGAFHTCCSCHCTCYFYNLRRRKRLRSALSPRNRRNNCDTATVRRRWNCPCDILAERDSINFSLCKDAFAGDRFTTNLAGNSLPEGTSCDNQDSSFE